MTARRNDGPHPQGDRPSPPAQVPPDPKRRSPDEDGVQGDEGSGGFNPDPDRQPRKKSG